MVQRYAEVEPADLPQFLEWVGMTKQEFMNCVWDRRDPKIWNRQTDGDWLLLDSILNHRDAPGVDAVRLQKIENCDYQITPSAEPNTKEDCYLLMGRGYVDKYDYGALEDQPVGGSLTPRTWQRPSLI